MAEQQLLLPAGKPKPKRPVIYDGPNLIAYGDRDRLVIVFKGDPAVYDRSQLKHQALNNRMRFETDDLKARFTHVRAIALLKGRGLWFLRENPLDKYIEITEIDTPGMIGAIGMNPNDPPEIGEETISRIIIKPLEKRWMEGSKQAKHFLGVNSPRWDRFEVRNGLRPESEVDYAIIIWGKKFVLNGCKELMTLDVVSWILDGLTETIVPPIKPKESRVQNHLPMVSLTVNLTPDSDPDYLMPIDYDSSMKLKHPRQRKLLREGGVKNFIEACTGTQCKSMVRIMASKLIELKGISQAAYMVKGSNEERLYDFPAVVKDELLYLRPLLESMTIDHRVRFMDLGMRSSSSRGSPYVNCIHNEESARAVQEFFTVASHTKILDKVEECVNLNAKLSPYFGEAIHNIPDDIRQFALDNEGVIPDPFPLMVDAGSQLLKWRQTKLTPKQQRYLPDGIKIKERWSTIKEIHDDISKQANKLESLAIATLMPWDEGLRKIHGGRCGSTRLLLPRTNQALVRWGKVQKHCVGSMYNKTMQRGECAIVGVFVDGVLSYCARLTKRKGKLIPKPEDGPGGVEFKVVEEPHWTLEEFRGLGNCWPNGRDAANVITIFEKMGINTEYWCSSYANHGGSITDGQWEEELKEALMQLNEVKFSEILVENFPTSEIIPDRVQEP